MRGKEEGLNVHWDIPAIFQARQRFSRNQREQLREKRRLFSPRMSGLDIVTLGSIPYSYYYDIRLRPYAYAFAFGHRLLGYIEFLVYHVSRRKRKMVKITNARWDVSTVDTMEANMLYHVKGVVIM